jgi:hypothetical protein
VALSRLAASGIVAGRDLSAIQKAPTLGTGTLVYRNDQNRS